MVGVHPGLKALGSRLSRWVTLSADDHAAIAGLSCAKRTYEAGQYLLREGDHPKVCSFLVSGLVFRHKIVGDGGRQIVSIHIPGDIIDLQNLLLSVADHSIQAMTATEILTFDTAEILRLAQTHPAISQAFWHESLVEASILREWIANIGRRDAYARTAHLLCELVARRTMTTGETPDIHELPTQEQLGDALGLTAVHINRTLRTLEAEGLIVRSKRAVKIVDWEGLLSAGDFTTAYLHPRDTRNNG
ncbi:Crp/Fnr family transcriptional regulator [soil metagenome]